jgi:hypothetical protein
MPLSSHELRRRGLLSRKTFMLIMSCLHADSRKAISDEKLNSAFNTFNALRDLFYTDSKTQGPPRKR